MTLPDAVYDLLESRIDSFEKLEIVVTLANKASMSIDELAQRVKLPRDEVRELVGRLRAAALVEITTRGDVQLLPPTNKDQAAVTELVRLHQEDRFTLVKTMGEISLARIRRLAAGAFADAFIIGKKSPKDGGDG